MDNAGDNRTKAAAVPLVSILIPCFNAERWVSQAVESALAQTHAPKEVIVVDDGSTDGSLKAIKAFGDRIRWETGPNRGGNAARNRLLKLARGDWLQYLDADDYLFPGKIARQAAFLAERQDTDVIFGPVTIERWSEQEAPLELLPIREPHDFPIVLAEYWLQTGVSLWRKAAVQDVGGWREDQPCCQEMELNLRLFIAGKRLRYCEAPGAVHRWWSAHSVAHKDAQESHGRRMSIYQRLEDHLRERRQLTAERLTAINEARFGMARAAWRYSRGAASDILKTIERSQPRFLPAGEAAPPAYRLFLKAFGFNAAETVADWRRAAMARGFARRETT